MKAEENEDDFERLISCVSSHCLQIMLSPSHEITESEGPSETRDWTGNVAYVDDKNLDLCLAEASC